MNLDWLKAQGIERAPDEAIYMAPIYGRAIDDPALLEQMNRLRPQHVVVTIGGGTQERLGLYLKRNLEFRPAIHCIGAAIAFLSGDQVHIPVWVDRDVPWAGCTGASPSHADTCRGTGTHASWRA